jgi:hypothetical protein
VQHDDQRYRSRLADFSGRSAVFRVARLSGFGLLGWLWFVSSDDSAWRIVSLVAVPALAALVGVTWFPSRARADRRWRAALDRYTKQELTKGTHLRRRHRG